MSKIEMDNPGRTKYDIKSSNVILEFQVSVFQIRSLFLQ